MSLRKIFAVLSALLWSTVSLAQQSPASLNKILADLNGSFNFSVKQFKGTDLVSQ